MLELAKILHDIDSFGRERAQAYCGFEDEIMTAERVIAEIGNDPADACRRISDARTSWLTATFVESPANSCVLPQLPDRHSVIAVDGSQIMADKHEVALCYLINTASIILYYGCGERPVSATHPELRYRDDQLVESYGGKDTRVDEKMVGIRRTVSEFQELEGALAVVHKKDVPAVALFDGSLILWTLMGEPDDFKNCVLNEYKRALDSAREYGIPVAGYISDPGSRDFVNSLKVMLCDEFPVDCDKCSYKARELVLPCDAVHLLKDSTVFGERLCDGERSVLFTSKSKILDDYGEHRVQAFYLNVGKEIVRIEVPMWVAENPKLLDLTHAVCCDQARKGRGYPVALSEAHEHAVVRGADRTAFYEAIQRSFIKHGAKVTRSMKRVSKGY